MNNSDSTMKVIIGIAFVIVFVVVTCFTDACGVDQGTAQRVLSAQGFTHVQVTDRAFFACSEDDAYASHFRARSPAGLVVEGTICCGWLKDCTVRW